MSTVQLVPALNGTLIDHRACNVDICSLDYAQVRYVPSLAANAAFLAIFVVLTVVHSFQMWRYRTFGFSGSILGGLFLEMVGYGGRIGMHQNVFSFGNFVIYLVCVTIGPAFFAAAIYLCLSRLVVAYGQDHARLRPRTYTLTFIACDFVSLALQAAGGAIAAQGNTRETRDMGVHIMVAGLVIQVVSLVVYIVLSLDFYRSVHRVSEQARNPDFAPLRATKLFHRYFPFGLAAAVFFIFVRCVYRVAELSGGFNGQLANDEKTFNALEGPMIILAVACLALFHPGRCFDGQWHRANWTVRGNDGRGLAGGATSHDDGGSGSLEGSAVNENYVLSKS